MLQLFTPETDGGGLLGRPAVRLVLAGLTLGGLAISSLVAIGALGALFAALGAIYFLVTEVLGIRLDFDPQAFVAQAREYARQTN
jgi:hypothetical protein